VLDIILYVVLTAMICLNNHYTRFYHPLCK
jgi:hypothetical protein